MLKRSRQELKRDFLTKSGISHKYNLMSLEADASLRRYDRVMVNNSTYIVMDSPPEHYSLVSFIETATVLREHGIVVPEIYAVDHVNGFMLLEDFGNVRMKDVIIERQDNIKGYYQLMVDVIIEIQKISRDTYHYFPKHSKESLMLGVDLFSTWYLRDPAIRQLKEYITKEWEIILHNLPSPMFFSLRDFHVENLMYLAPLVTLDKPRIAIKSDNIQELSARIAHIGVLDFQDATVGYRAYDIVSLLEDARHAVPVDIADSMIEYYISKADDIDVKHFTLEYHILGAQRNSRILGLFRRKVLHEKQGKYAEFIPTVKKYLERDLAHPVLSNIREIYKEIFSRDERYA